MEWLTEAVCALLLTAGVLALAWRAFGRLLAPIGVPGGPTVWCVVRGEGDGRGLEQTVRGLLWLRGGAGGSFAVLIADGGLDEAGRAIASTLSQREDGVYLCPLEALPGEIQNRK